jgi:hypothetical protein
MRPDLVALQSRYAKLDTRDLLRLSRDGGFIPEVQKLIDDELAQRRDRDAAITSERAADIALVAIARGGLTPADVQQDLIRQGLAPDAAADAVGTAEATLTDAKMQALDGRIVSGGVLLALGLAVTAYTHMAAANTGGYYIVAWGAVLAGGVQCARGVLALLAARRNEQRDRSQ